MRQVVSYIFVILFFSLGIASASSDYEAQKLEAESARLHIANGEYEKAYKELLPLFDKENVVAIHYLGVMKYFGLHVIKDLDIAARLFFTASKNGEEGGNIESAYWLARNFYLNPNSPHFNESEGIRLIYGVELSGHIEGAFFNGNYTMNKLSSAKDKEKLIKFAIQSFDIAYRGGKLEAAPLWYVLENELQKHEPSYVHQSYEALLTAADNENDLQAEAAYEIALLYKKGKYFKKSRRKYIEYLALGADKGDRKSAYFLGKAYLIGVINDPNYDDAEFYTQYAIDNAGGDNDLRLAGQVQLELIQKKRQEEAISSFERPIDNYLNILAMQHFINSQKLSSSADRRSVLELQTDTVSEQNKPITTYAFSNDNSFMASGTRYRRTGNRIKGSDGSNYRISANRMTGSDGSSYRLLENSIRGSDGTNYRFVGKNIYGSDGSRCRITGSTTRCY